MRIKKFIRNISFGKPIVVVSGLPRSGTSMLMKMLDAGGEKLVTDGVRTADHDNPKGYYELEQVKDLDKDKDKAWLKELRGKTVKIISFLLKDLPTYNNYKVVFIERNLHEVIASQNKMLKNRNEEGGNISDDKMIANYENHLWRVKYLIKHNPQFDAIFVKHKDILNQPSEMARKINNFLGHHLNEENMATVVDPALYRNKISEIKKS